MAKILLKTIDYIILLKKPLWFLALGFFQVAKFIGRIFILPIVLPAYRLFLKTKIYWRHLKMENFAYLKFIKIYLPRITIFIIIVIVTTHNIMAKTYGIDQYTNNNLLPAVLSDTDIGWSELIEEDATVYSEPVVSNQFLEEQGALQELVINTPFPEEVFTGESTNTSVDSSSLVQVTPQEEVAPRDAVVMYTVQNGDVLGKIAEKFGISVNTVLWANNLTWSSTIKAGQKLKILPSSGIEHPVKSGDTVLAIAKKYQSEAQAIISYNKLANASDIKSGDLLFIPNGVKPTQITSSYQPKPSNSPANTTNEKLPPAAIDSNTKLLWPVLSQRITQYYGLNHTGLDIGDKTGNPIYAAESGKVEAAAWNAGGYGYYVIINHGNGLKTLYGHSSKLLVKAGDTVTRGETIALVGSTGRSTGPHLHFEVRINDSRTNPLNYIK